MTRAQMLHAEVSHRLSIAGQPADADAVVGVVTQAREDAAFLLSEVARSLDFCEEADCNCQVMAVVYRALAVELKESV